jgi:hypothetical protein
MDVLKLTGFLSAFSGLFRSAGNASAAQKLRGKK